MNRLETIKSKLQQALAPERLEITDDSHLHAGHAGAAAGGGHFPSVSPVPGSGGTPLCSGTAWSTRQFDDMMPGEIHALSIKARTPEEEDNGWRVARISCQLMRWDISLSLPQKQIGEKSGANIRPFLKWPGGKYRLLSRIRKALHPGKRLIEPFVGSGAVFLNTDYDTYLLADANPDLISLYTQLLEERPFFHPLLPGFF